jgi:tetratricopeptide (TPR) repeat protein
VPLIVKPPGDAGAGRRGPQPVQHIDVRPTLLDVVRAPMPSGLRGRSLRTILDKTGGFVPDQPIYAEFLAPRFRFDGTPLFAISNATYRFVRGIGEQMQPLVDGPRPDQRRLDQMASALDKLLEGTAIQTPAPPASMDEDRLAAFGYLQGLPPAEPVMLDGNEQEAVGASHRRAAALVAQKRYAAALDALRGIATKHPELTSVQYQIAALLARTGRIDDAVKTLTALGAARAGSPEIPLALASTLLRSRRFDEAAMQADRAVELADADASGWVKAAAHEVAARVALARGDNIAAAAQADAARKADPRLPMPQFVAGRLAYDEERYEDALAAFKEAAAALERGGETLAELHLSLGNTYARLDRYAEAEAEFREELREYPHGIATYASLAMLYRASNREQAVEHVIADLVEAAPTPEGYSMAARLWTIVGERARAEALRSDARQRFKGDPSLALLGRSR